jgi:hypothetical protein
MNVDLKQLADQVLKRSKKRTYLPITCEQTLKKPVHQLENKSKFMNEEKSHKSHSNGKKDRSDWTPEELSLIQSFSALKAYLPINQFKLKPGVLIIDPEQFYLSLKADIELGPKRERTLFGALQDDLRCLESILKPLIKEQDLTKEM